MSLIARMEEEVKQAMLARDNERRDTLRLILSSLKSAESSPTSRKVSRWRSGITITWTSARGLMSRKATKPSARPTTSAGTSPATMRQKMQASGSENPLLRDSDRAGPHELADSAVDQPR